MIDFSATTQLIAFCVLAGIAFLLLVSDIIALIRVRKHRAGFLGVVFFIFAFIILLASFLLSLMILIKRITPFGLDAVVFNNDVIITLDGETGLPIPFIGGFMSLVFDYIVLESLVYAVFALSLFAVILQPLKWKKRDELLAPVKSADGDGYFTVRDGLNFDEDDFQPLPEDEYSYVPASMNNEPLPEDGYAEEKGYGETDGYTEEKGFDLENNPEANDFSDKDVESKQDADIISDNGFADKDFADYEKDVTHDGVLGEDEAFSQKQAEPENQDEYESRETHGGKSEDYLKNLFDIKPAPLPEDEPFKAQDDAIAEEEFKPFNSPKPDTRAQSADEIIKEEPINLSEAECGKPFDQTETNDIDAQKKPNTDEIIANTDKEKSAFAVKREIEDVKTQVNRRKRVTVKSNAAEMFSEYLMSRDGEDKEKLEKSIDRIYIEHKRD